jgi:hypothetical protein
MAVKTLKTQAAVTAERRYSRVWAGYFKLHTGTAELRGFR